MSKKRSPISKKVRFEVFKRDSFKCQYCGNSAPDVILHVDHINPVSKGGDNDIMNLITSCVDCNSGKSDRLLSDASVIEKQRAQLEELNERREQLEQMLLWREGLKDINDMAVTAARDAWSDVSGGHFSINETGEKSIWRLIKKFGLNTVLDAIEECGRYLKHDSDGKPTTESANEAFGKIGGICRLKSQPDYKREIYYIRGILRNRINYVNEHQCIKMLEEAYQKGVPIEELKAIATSVKNWTTFRQQLYCAIEERDGEG